MLDSSVFTTLNCNVDIATAYDFWELNPNFHVALMFEIFFYIAYVYRVGQKRGHRLMTIILSYLNQFTNFVHLNIP